MCEDHRYVIHASLRVVRCDFGPEGTGSLRLKAMATAAGVVQLQLWQGRDARIKPASSRAVLQAAWAGTKLGQAAWVSGFPNFCIRPRKRFDWSHGAQTPS